MLRVLLIILFLFTASFCYSQDVVLSEPISTNSSSWRKIDVQVDVTKDFTSSFVYQGVLDTKAVENQVRSLFAFVNQSYRPLKIYFNLANISIPEQEDIDYYQSAIEKRSPFEILRLASQRYPNDYASKYHLHVVLARYPFPNYSGLAYPSTSCVARKYSIVFATQAGDSQSQKYVLSQTLAHEIGHYLGMGHDENKYNNVPTLMFPDYVTHTAGFSQKSINEALEHSGEGKAGGECFSKLSDDNVIYSKDEDGDGVSDSQEQTDGTNFKDSGSFSTALKSPVYAMWNGFLETINILELVNPLGQDNVAIVSLFSLEGDLLNKVNVQLKGFGQFDLILNELSGFKVNSYGLVKIEFEGILDGRASYYKNLPNSSSYEFAYSIPFLNPTYGRSAVGFNTFQPSRNPNEAKNQVANWLTLVNLSEASETFTINSFNSQGNIIRVEVVDIAAHARVDLDGGHGFAGHSNVGFHEILPSNPSVAYQAQLIRYGSNAMDGEIPTSYSFAYPLIAKSGNGELINLFIETESELEENWLELVNTAEVPINVEIGYFREDGWLVKNSSVQIQPHAQVHLNASEVLREAGLVSGLVSLISDTSESLIAQSMFYARNIVSGSIDAMYGTQARESLEKRINGSYNLFLGMKNILRLANTSNRTVEATVEVSSSEGVAVKQIKIPAHGFSEIQVSKQGFASAYDATYGLVSVSSTTQKALISDILRVRSLGLGELDFIAPSEMR